MLVHEGRNWFENALPHQDKSFGGDLNSLSVAAQDGGAAAPLARYDCAAPDRVCLIEELPASREVPAQIFTASGNTLSVTTAMSRHKSFFLFNLHKHSARIFDSAQRPSFYT